MVALALRTNGFNVIEAANGAMGVSLARAHLPDLILCDYQMDQLDGYKALAALREDPSTAAIPFILVTGAPAQAGQRESMNLGADDYLLKPFTINELLAAVNTRLQKQEAMQKRADRKIEELRHNLVSTLPHELNAPLNSILGYAAYVRADFDDLSREEVIAVMEGIYQSGLRLQRLIQSYLAYTELEMLAANPEKVAAFRGERTANLRDFVTHEAKQVAERYQRNTDLKLDLADGIAAIGSKHLSRLIGALLDNAFKFSRCDTSVQVQGRVSPEGFVITIHNEGKGMTPQQLAAVGAYMQFERSVYEQQGCGLGLTIAQRLTELCGGTLSLQSEAKAGTTATVTLPIA